MRRAAYSLLALCATLAATSSAVAAPIQTFEAKASSNKAGQPTDFTLGGTTSEPDGSKPPGVRSIKIISPRGAKINFGLATKCDRELLAADGKCPDSSKVSKSASARARVDFGGLGELEINKIDVYRGLTCESGALGCAYIYGSELVTGVTTIIDAQVFKHGSVYEIDIPNAQLPPVLGVEPVLTNLAAKIGKRDGKRSIYTNPKSCPKGGWAATLDISYEDGSSNQVKATQKCKK